MSQDFFLQLMKTPTCLSLREQYPDAFLLITTIAWRAKISDNDSSNTLELGQAYIGDYETFGLTERRYRTAKMHLKKMKLIDCISSTQGTIAWLCNEKVYKLNIQYRNQKGIDGQQTDDRRTSDGRRDGRRDGRILETKLEKETDEKTDYETGNSAEVGGKETTKKEVKKYINIESKDSFARTAARPRTEIYFSFDFRKFENIEDADYQAWKQAYPAVDLQHEILLMVEWCLSNPQKAKSKKLWRKFITNWLSRTNENKIDKESRKSAGTNGYHSFEEKNKAFVCTKLKNSERYGNWECSIGDKAIGFTAIAGQGHHEIKFTEHGFEQQLDGMLRKLKISI